MNDINIKTFTLKLLYFFLFSLDHYLKYTKLLYKTDSIPDGEVAVRISHIEIKELLKDFAF